MSTSTVLRPLVLHSPGTRCDEAECCARDPLPTATVAAMPSAAQAQKPGFLVSSLALFQMAFSYVFCCSRPFFHALCGLAVSCASPVHFPLVAHEVQLSCGVHGAQQSALSL